MSDKFVYPEYDYSRMPNLDDESEENQKRMKEIMEYNRKRAVAKEEWEKIHKQNIN